MSRVSSAHEEPSIDELRDAHATDALPRYLGEMWRRREYVRYVALSELRARQMNSLLGNLWYLLNPVLLIGIYALVFGIVLDARRGVDNFIAFLTIGTLIFAYIQRSTIAGAKSIVSNLGLIRTVGFPRAVLPLSACATELLATAPSIALIVGVPLATGETPSLRWALLLPIIALVALFNVGTAMIAARATSIVLDVQQVLPFVFRLLLYASGVLFSAEAYATGRYELLFELNPVYDFLTMSRWALLGGSLDPIVPISAIAWTAVVLTGGFVWFQRGEHSYGLN